MMQRSNKTNGEVPRTGDAVRVVRDCRRTKGTSVRLPVGVVVCTATGRHRNGLLYKVTIKAPQGTVFVEEWLPAIQVVRATSWTAASLGLQGAVGEWVTKTGITREYQYDVIIEGLNPSRKGRANCGCKHKEGCFLPFGTKGADSCSCRRNKLECTSSCHARCGVCTNPHGTLSGCKRVNPVVAPVFPGASQVNGAGVKQDCV